MLIRSHTRALSAVDYVLTVWVHANPQQTHRTVYPTDLGFAGSYVYANPPATYGLINAGFRPPSARALTSR